MEYKPYDYQLFAEQFIIDNPEAGALLDMGLGKTVITLSAVDKLMFDYFSVNRVLVIAPLPVITDTWPKEILKWDHLQNLSLSVVTGNAEHRKAALQKDVSIYAINRENVPWLVDFYKSKWPFDMVIIDELSSFKSPKAQRFKSLKKVRKYIKRIVGLTGTPGDLLSFWPQAYLLDEGKSLGRSITAYREQYFIPDKRNATTIFSWKTKDGAENEIYKKLEPLCISMKAKDYVELPERIDVNHDIALGPKDYKIYKQLEQDSLLEFKDGDIDAATAAILVNKLLQFSSGAVYDENRNVKEFHTAKLDMLENLIEQANGQPVLVFYSYKHELDRIKAKYPSAKTVDEQCIITEWNKGNVPILLAHPASAGHGLNLQAGGHIIIWFSLPWSLELYQQANARLLRLGQTEPVLIHHLLIAGSMDSRVLSVLQQKEETQETFLAALKAKFLEG